MNVNSPWIRGFARVVGTLTAWTLGRVDRYTPEDRKFLSSGFVWQNCGRTLLTKYLVADVKCYDPSGNVVPLTQARCKGKYFECPHCLHRWIFRTPWGQKFEERALYLTKDDAKNGNSESGLWIGDIAKGADTNRVHWIKEGFVRVAGTFSYSSNGGAGHLGGWPAELKDITFFNTTK